MPMYQVETVREEYRTYIVEAASQDEAEEKVLEDDLKPNKIVVDGNYIHDTTELKAEDFE